MTSPGSKNWAPALETSTHPPQLSAENLELIDSFPAQEAPDDLFYCNFETFGDFVSENGGNDLIAPVIWGRLFDRARYESYLLHEGVKPYVSYSMKSENDELVEMFRRYVLPAEPGQSGRRQEKDTEQVHSKKQLDDLDYSGLPALSTRGLLMFIQNNGFDELRAENYNYVLTHEQDVYLKAFAAAAIKSLNHPQTNKTIITV